MENTNDPSLHVPLLSSHEPPKKTYLKTNFIDNYFLFWVGKLVTLGKQKPFQQDMHWDLRQQERSEQITKRLSVEFQRFRNKKNPLFKALAVTVKSMWIKTLLMKFVNSLLEYSGPLLIRLVINYIDQEERDIQTGVLLVLGIVFSRIIIALIDARASIVLTLMGIQTSNAVNGLVYEKALKFSLIRSVDHSQGSLINHMQVDSEKLFYLGLGIGGCLILPFTLFLGFYFMWMAVGVAFLAGLGLLIVVSGLNYWLSAKYFKIQNQLMEKKDDRMKVTTEILNGIKYIKMSGWEKAFLAKVMKSREGELGVLKNAYVLSTFSVFTMWLTPMLTTAAIFTTYILLGNEMTAATAFTLISTIFILENSAGILPYCISLIIEAKVALDRVTKYLLSEDLHLECIQYSDDTSSTDVAIKVEKGNFFWLTEAEKIEKEKKQKEEEEKKKKEEEAKNGGKKEEKKVESASETGSVVVSSQKTEEELQLNSESPVQIDLEARQSVSNAEGVEYKLILKDINMEIKKGSFVVILGDVGSGKSSFLFSLVGEMKYDHRNPPKIEVNGNISYVTQQPWIQNGAVKDNIVFGKPFNESEYKDAIKFSSLQADLDILINKDQTEIGEKGVNLSGGQKARISLARALYRNSDIYLLDDPLSAVDAHVGNFILKECFVKHLSNKTRVLVTHKFESLKYADYIYIFKKGRIVEQGTLETLQSSDVFHEIEEKYKMKSEAKAEAEAEAIEEAKLPEEEKKEDQALALMSPVEEEIKPEDVKEKEEIQKITAEEDKALQEKLMLDEDREIGSVGWNVWKSYFNYYGGWCYFFIVFFVMFIYITLATASNFWLSKWSDDVKNPEFSQIYYLEIYSILSLSYAFFCLIRIALLYMQSLRCSRQLHKDMVTNVIRAPVNLFFDRVPSGRIINRLSKDLTVLDNYIAQAFGSLTVCFYGLAADIIVCLIIGSVWVFPLAIIFFFASYRVQKSYMTLNREVVRLESISKSPIVSFFSESLMGLTSIRSFHEQKQFIKRFHHLQSEHIKNLILQAGLGNWFNLRVTFCTVLVIAPSVSIPLLITSHQAVSAGIMALLITYVIQINDSIVWFLWCVSNFESKLIALERCRTFTLIDREAPPETQAPEQLQNYSEDWPARGAIRFKNYSTRYRPNLPLVVSDLNVRISNGEKVGVVGRTGSGKSTLFLSLLRILEPAQGTILIDDVDITHLGLDDLRKKITIIPQDPILFKGSLRSNLDLLNKYTDEELWQSLERVCMKEKFQQEKGLDTEIKEGGENLSAGEKQLLCIGRAILAQSKIILIDEATSNIDPKTEQVILDTIHNCFEDCTVITVAHRLKTIINSDKIMLMSQGKLLEFDSPKTLVADPNTHFHKLWSEYEHGAKKESS